ncbi:uncharacterized protein EDB93DRAFT_1101802 [Suillus bovinus]|uniref:uncharacterized protein n=1 Tax=Suillus bovinus TaxID=48563 RepID=UPI001B87EB70|nr:uncharacterized protein EDB93DRAFT_1101802 [Suillus bovinus]KAG2155227.1 hypothetical protein EDB93DRAFT_1101802 [Suillus bovinus]
MCTYIIYVISLLAVLIFSVETPLAERRAADLNHLELGTSTTSTTSSVRNSNRLILHLAELRYNFESSWISPGPLLFGGMLTNLPLIPNEIYLAIFECITPTDHPLERQYIKTFSALALVCRFFCSVALPRLFEHVTFSGYVTNGNRMRRKTKWARQIAANTKSAKSIALYVKECNFKFWFFTRGPDHWDALAELKQLDVLEFYICSFIEDPPDKELTVRTVKLVDTRRSLTTFTLRPIATTSMRSLTADDVEAVLKIVAFRQLAIDNLVLNQAIFDVEPLLQVFRHLPDLQSLSFGLKGNAAPSLLISKLSLKKLFTRLHSLTIKVVDDWEVVPRHDFEMLVSALCDGPGTLPSLQELNISDDGWTIAIDIISDRLNGTIIPAFPNMRCINVDNGFIRLEEGDWKVHYFK